jgi:hypothetical protein
MESGDGAKLAGTFRRDDYQTLSPGAQQGITFMPDGRFKGEGIFKAAFVQNPPAATTISMTARRARGRTESSTTASSSYDNGRAKRASVYIDPGSAGGDVTAFWFNSIGSFACPDYRRRPIVSRYPRGTAMPRSVMNRSWNAMKSRRKFALRSASRPQASALVGP